MINPLGGFQKKSLKIALSAGIILTTGICMALIFLSLSPERSLFSVSGMSERDVFHRLLREYDAFFAPEQGKIPGLPSTEADSLIRQLDKLEKKARGVETWLSVLKRRRNLALSAPRFIAQYRESAIKAAAAFPYSEPLAAVAAEAILYNSPSDNESAGVLKNYASLITEPRLTPLALGIHILLGGMQSPDSALAPHLEPLLAAGLPLIRGELPLDERDSLTANLGILKLLLNDYSGAAAQIQAISAETRGVQGESIAALLHFIAEYYYDFGDPLRAAEIFSRFSDEASMGRSADALWLGGNAASARNIWRILAARQDSVPAAIRQGASSSADAASPIRIRSLYNLAAAAEDQKEESAWLERLFAEGRNSPSLQSDPCFHYGIIRYTRLLDTKRALAILEEGELSNQPLMDLELLRRRGELWPADRTVAETWLLLGRHPEEAALYQWGAYYFDYQRKPDETAMLIKTAAFHQIGGPWLDLSAGLRFIEEGLIDEGEERLRAIPRSAKIWQADANLGRILEARLATAAALECYESAATLVKNPEAASRVRFRIAGCLRTLGRIEESRRVLEYALDLNPDNLKARMELRKINNER
jgi:tetratricopeptide (TPR) repeat protein